MKTTLLQLGLLSIAIGVSASAQTYTTIMSGESSTSFSFINNNTGNRTSVTSLQSPYGFPGTITGANDTQTFPSGSTGGNPEPWWFYYGTCGSNTCAYDLTGMAIPRGPSYGQVSSQKSSLIGLWVNAAFEGTASTSDSSDAATVDEVAFLTVRDDYQGQQEIGIARQMSPYAYNTNSCDPTPPTPPCNSGDYLYGYWFTNDNCFSQTAGAAAGPPTTTLSALAGCQTSQANSSIQAVGIPPSGGMLLQTGFSTICYICPPSQTLGTCQFTGTTTSYVFQTYIFYADWDDTYKQRVEVWNSAFTENYFGENLDTTNINTGAMLGLTTSGTSGYITVGTEQLDPGGNPNPPGTTPAGTLISSVSPAIALAVSQVQMITP